MDVDAVDRLLLSQLRTWVVDVAEPSAGPATVVVFDDQSGSLTLGAADVLLMSAAAGAPALASVRVRVACDSRRSHDAVQARLADAPGRVAGMVEVVDSYEEAVDSAAMLVLARLPKGLAALDELAATVAARASQQATFVVAARDKFLSRTLNAVLAAHFNLVTASLGQQKCRALLASTPRALSSSPNPAPDAERDAAGSRYPLRHHHADLDLVVCAHGAAFAGTSVDRGTRLLLSCLDKISLNPDAAPLRIVDLGCGTGLLAASAARHFPTAQVLAVDDALAAVRSAQATAAANGLADRIGVRWADGLAETQPASSTSPAQLTGPSATLVPASPTLRALSSPAAPLPVQASAPVQVSAPRLAPPYDLILCNPPFHRGTTKESATAFAMIRDAGVLLRPGGELWLVYNAHLPYLPALRRHVGRTTVEARDRDYLVTRSTRRASTV